MTAQFKGHPDDQRACIDVFRRAAFNAIYYGVDIGTLLRVITEAEVQVSKVNAQGLAAMLEVGRAFGHDPRAVMEQTYTRRLDGTVWVSGRGVPGVQRDGG